MKKLILGTLLAASATFTQAQQEVKQLQFNPDGTFKIAQFTDMHLNDDAGKAQIVTDMIREVLDSEKPDLVVFTGDNTVFDAVEPAWQQLAQIMAERQIPWTAVLGNHDDEHKVSRKEIIEIIAAQPYSMLQNPATGITGEGNHVLPVYKAGSNRPEALLYCFDSNAYSVLPSVKGYGWFDTSQINWYAAQSKQFAQQNGGTPLPALAFFHIPLPEYGNAWDSMKTRRYGEKNENECPPEINSGMFTKMLECGDVMGTFVGHDHVNDYIATLYDVALGYGRASGGENTYGDKKPGSRIIVLKEGQRAFDTYIREKGNPEQIFFCTYPDSFRKEK